MVKRRFANIKITQDWWDEYSSSLVLYVSEIVEDEASRGYLTIAEQRRSLLHSLTFLTLTEEAIALGQELLQQSNLPPKAFNDALHIALATVYGLDYLLIWNCKHIANA